MVNQKTNLRRTFVVLTLLASLLSMGQSASGNNVYLPLIMKTTPPLAAVSYYIQDGDPAKLYDLGCALGDRDRIEPGTQDNLVILDFGKMWTYEENNQPVYGVRLFSKDGTRQNISLIQMREVAKQFAYGYWYCTKEDLTSHLTLGVGTNNYDHFNTLNLEPDNLKTLAGDFGRNWAYIINDLNTWAVEVGYSPQVTFAGAIDIEWGMDPDGTYTWNTPYVTRGWVDEFSLKAKDNSIYFNYGACVGCPTTVDPSWYYTVPMPWSQDHVWYVSWGAPPAFSVPEIYRNDGYLARQWAAVSLYGSTYLKTSRIVFSGVMTQAGACSQRADSDPSCETLDNTPAEGWYQMVAALQAINDPTPYPRWSTDIRWQIK